MMNNSNSAVIIKSFSSNSINKNTGSSNWNAQLEKHNRNIEKLKKKIQLLRNNDSDDRIESLQQALNKEFEMLEQIVKSNLENHSMSTDPTIIHLATTTEEDNIPPFILRTANNQGKNNLQTTCRSLPSDQQRQAEEKFQIIQKKLIDLCQHKSEDGSQIDGETNLNDDIKQKFDDLYSELRVLEKELFHGGCSEYDSFDDSEKLAAFDKLKQQNAMLIQQGEQFQVLFQEQQMEIENYREKYMETLQNVMEQHMRISAMEDESKNVEKKTCEEILRIKDNLKKRLNHLEPMSDMLQKCNRKLVHTLKTKTEIEQNYEDMCEELRQLKKELLKKNVASRSLLTKCDYLGAELMKSRELNELNQQRLDQMQEQLKKTRSELESIKLKCSQTIKSTIKKCDFLRCELQSRINELEIELAKSKAIITAQYK